MIWAGFAAGLLVLVATTVAIFRARQRDVANSYVASQIAAAKEATDRQMWDEAIELLNAARNVPDSTRGAQCMRLLEDVRRKQATWQEVRLVAAADKAIDDGQIENAFQILKGRVDGLHSPAREQAVSLLSQIDSARSIKVAQKTIEAMPDAILNAAPDFDTLARANRIDKESLKAVFKANVMMLLPAERIRREAERKEALAKVEQKRRDDLAKVEQKRREEEALAKVERVRRREEERETPNRPLGGLPRITIGFAT
jgi:hypothetical protein